MQRLQRIPLPARNGIAWLSLCANRQSGNASGSESVARPDLSRDKFGHPRIPNRGYFEEDKCDERREWCSQFSGASLDYLGDWWPVDGRRDAEASSKFPTTMLKGNIENPIGMLTIPVSSTGPLLVRGRHINASVLVPYATTEPGVSASATRGARAISASGGAVSRVTDVCQRRSPVFVTGSLVESQRLAEWLEQQLPRLRAELREVSEHGRLRKVQPHPVGRALHVNFFYSTGDAGGQNMVTSLSNKACQWITKTVKEELAGLVHIRGQMIEGGSSGDKRNSWMNLTMGRGIAVQSEVFMPESVVQSTFGLSSERLQRCYEACAHGISLSGGATVNITAADSLAAIYTASGQDVACLTENTANTRLTIRLASSREVRRFQKKMEETGGLSSDDQALRKTSKGTEGGIYASMYIPNLSIGTVGGGTMLPTQKECLSIMGCFGSGGVMRFAEIIAASTLGLDLSALASLASGRRMYSLKGTEPTLAPLRKKEC